MKATTIRKALNHVIGDFGTAVKIGFDDVGTVVNIGLSYLSHDGPDYHREYRVEKDSSGKFSVGGGYFYYNAAGWATGPLYVPGKFDSIDGAIEAIKNDIMHPYSAGWLKGVERSITCFYVDPVNIHKKQKEELLGWAYSTVGKRHFILGKAKSILS